MKKTKLNRCCLFSLWPDSTSIGTQVTSSWINQSRMRWMQYITLKYPYLWIKANEMARWPWQVWKGSSLCVWTGTVEGSERTKRHKEQDQTGPSREVRPVKWVKGPGILSSAVRSKTTMLHPRSHHSLLLHLLKKGINIYLVFISTT